MLRISHVQQQALSHASRESFSSELRLRMIERTPELARTFDERRLVEVVRSIVASARAYGLSYRGPVRLYFDLCVSLGSGFVEDPVYLWAMKAIGDRDPSTQMKRAEVLFARSLTALHEIHGSRNEHARAALGALKEWASRAGAPFAQNEESAILEMRTLHPQKAAHAGDTALRSLYRAANAACQEFGVHAPRPIMLITALKFAFGAGCLTDPLYGWIGAALTNPRTPTMKRRFEHLERRALIWLDAALKNQPAG